MEPIAQRDLALSTMWNFRKAKSGRALIDQILALGFTRVELNYQVRPEWLGDIERAVRAGEIRAVSVHNVFPRTEDQRFDTDSMMLGYLDEGLRRQAVTLCKRSIDWACRLGAGAVVYHPTEVPLPPQRFDRPLKRLIAAHSQDSEAFRTLQREMLAARDSAPYMAQMMKSLEALCDYVVQNNLPVRLGMENRAMCHQAPIFSEFEPIVRRVGGGPIGLWLDTGHAIMMQEMGLQQMPLAEDIARHIVGMHIHDAADGLDHYAPCTLPGDVLAPFMPLIRRSPIRVLELSGRLSADEILTGTRRFIERFNAGAAGEAEEARSQARARETG